MSGGTVAWEKSIIVGNVCISDSLDACNIGYAIRHHRYDNVPGSVAIHPNPPYRSGQSHKTESEVGPGRTAPKNRGINPAPCHAIHPLPGISEHPSGLPATPR